MCTNTCSAPCKLCFLSISSYVMASLAGWIRRRPPEPEIVGSSPVVAPRGHVLRIRNHFQLGRKGKMQSTRNSPHILAHAPARLQASLPASLSASCPARRQPASQPAFQQASQPATCPVSQPNHLAASPLAASQPPLSQLQRKRMVGGGCVWGGGSGVDGGGGGGRVVVEGGGEEDEGERRWTRRTG